MPIQPTFARGPARLLSGGNRSVRFYRTIAVTAAAIMLVRVSQTMLLFSNNCDEPYHIASAVVMYDLAKQASGVAQPPLARIVSGLPLYLRGVHLPRTELTTTVVGLPETYLQGTQVLFRSNLSYWQVLLTARLSMLAFPLIALLYLYLLAAYVGNELIAALSVVFFSLDPTLLGHSTWVSTDVAACAGFLAATYHALRWLTLGGRGRAVVAGIAVGVAIAAKFSCIFVIPVIGLLLAVRLLPFTSKLPKAPPAYFRRLPPIGQMAMVAVVAFVTLWATYFFNVDRLSNQRIFPTARSEFQHIPASIRNATIPMPSLALGLMEMLSLNRFGSKAYLNGRFSDSGWWYYFPEAIALKEPLALLGGLLAAAFLFFLPACRPKWWPATAILIPPAVFLAAASIGHLDIGIRHVLPALPFLYLLVCFQLVRTGAKGLALVGVLIVAAMIESAWIAPNYTDFFNLIAGGPARGARYLIDSNIDYGQDVARLAEWLNSDQARGRSYSLRLFMFPDKSLCRMFGLDPAALFRNLDGGLLAISKNVRYGLGAGKSEEWLDRPMPDYGWLSQFPIVKQIGYSIDVYDLDSPQRTH